MALSSGYWETWVTTVNKTIGVRRCARCRYRRITLACAKPAWCTARASTSATDRPHVGHHQLYRINAAGTFDLIGTS